MSRPRSKSTCAEGLLHFGIILILLLLPFLEIFQLIKFPFILKIVNFIIPYQFASFIGFFFFLNEKGSKLYYVCFVLLLVSVGWVVVFHNELRSFCTAS